MATAVLAAALLTALHLLLRAPQLRDPGRPALDRAVAGACAAVLACSSVVLYANRRIAWCRVALGLKAFFAIVYLPLAVGVADVQTAVVAALVLEIALYEASVISLMESSVVVVLAAVVRGLSVSAVAGQGGLGAFARLGLAPHLGSHLSLLLLAVSACLFVYYRERCIDHTEHIARLDGAVAKLAEANLGYQHYASEAEARSQIEERHRITRELHDIIGYTFTNNIMMLEAAVSKIHKDPDKVSELIGLARENAKTGLEKIRQSLRLLRAREQLRSTTMDRIGRLVRVFRIATGAEVVADYTNCPSVLPEEVEEFLYCFVQEGLTNAFRHGAATRISVVVQYVERGLLVSVRDNGKGTDTIREGIGLAGMRERLARLGGTLTIPSRQEGFEVTAEVPLAGVKESAHAG